MPTEAEWEYVAASAGESSRRYPWGEEDPDKDRANYNFNEGDTTEVDGYPEVQRLAAKADQISRSWPPLQVFAYFSY